MFQITFLAFVLIGMNNHRVIYGAPTPDGNNELPESKITKMTFDSSRDPIGEMPGEPLSPADFKNAKELTLGPNFHDFVDGSPNGLGGQKGLFEGDIVGVLAKETASVTGQKNGTKMNSAVVDMTLTWPSGTVPYVISASFGKRERTLIAKAILEFHNKTCLRFVPRTNQDDYINILNANGCSSNVGRAGGEQQVSLGMGCFYVGIIMHELMHAVGFWHEQSRTDRDDHIIIHWKNIMKGMEYNFQKYDQGRIQYLSLPYDTGSIMHYDAYAFAEDKRYPTITSKKSDEQLGQRNGFSDSDVLKLNRLYKCKTNSSEQTSVTTSPAATRLKPTPVKEKEKSKDRCLDDHKYCKIWTERGECARNSWMAIHCRKSCNQCDGQCSNLNENCIRWAQSGECQKNSSYMKIYCRKSCHLCDDTDRSSDCVDDDRMCPAWATRDGCKANSNFMQLHCRKSCGEC
ncbi:Metalloendopeptidase [Daphnia magna]|uniref:Metalloendopeptidase n=1 Tax=Daphnia magna TaxID=35525 RepID=A0A164YQH7_9CRUS|nr:Metalloendopeptidase [Daphnia magna]